MQVSYNWLKTYIDFPYNAEELEHVLTMAGLEVEEVEYKGEGLEKIVIGEVKEVKDHPNADKLLICNVDNGEEVIQIVTGAPNVKKGVKAPLAQVGVTLPGGMKMKKVKLRGIESFGMLCSTDELALSEERADGIMILDNDAQPGDSFIEHIGLDDYILKLDLTPNYSRCLGMMGIARELAAILNDKEVNYPDIKLEEDESINIKELVSVEVKNTELCPRYTGRIIKDVKIGPSPVWMQQRLKAAGIRPINNIVDITNYILLEYNQPLHAFDYDKITGSKVIVRNAEQKEKLITLDDQERELNGEILVIADEKQSIGLAGVMGGANTEVTEETSTIFLEAAYFDPVNIRKTARKLSLPSESSHRFERGIDIEKVVEAGNRAAYLMQEYAGGTVVSGVIDNYHKEHKILEIELDCLFVNKILGVELDSQEIKNLLERLEFEVTGAEENLLNVKVPSYRNDVEREADLIEEVARLYGYNKFPSTQPASRQVGGKNLRQQLEDITRNIMISSGLSEVINFSLTDREDYRVLNLEKEDNLNDWVELKNPLNESYAVLRTSLIPGFLETLSSNAKRQIESMAIYELGNVFFNNKDKSSENKSDSPYCQEMKLAGASMGAELDFWKNDAPDFFYLKGVLEKYFKRMGIVDYRFKAANLPYLHPGRTAEIILCGSKLGYIGEILPELNEKLDLKERTAVFEIDFKSVCDMSNLENNYQDLAKYPAVERDLAVLVKKKVNAGDLLNTIREEAGSLLKKADLFDLYQGDQIPGEQKSLAFKLLFQADDRTLRDEEVNTLFNSILNKISKKYNAKIRGK